MNTTTFRQALGHFPTGVTIVTAGDANGDPVGITANSFSSLSLEPPLILWSIARSSSRFEVFSKAAQFAVHILHTGQQALADKFCSQSTRQFDALSYETGSGNTPLLSDYLARFECDTTHRYEGGDHLILVGRVRDLRLQEQQGLVFYRGKYAAVGPPG